MKHKIVMVTLSVALIVGLILTGCVPEAIPEGEEEVPSEEVVRLTMAGGSIGGFGNIRANCFAGIAKKFLGIDTTVITYSTLAFPRALHEGFADVAGGLDYNGYSAYTGTGAFAGEEPYLELRGLTYTWERILQIFTLKGSDIRAVSDLRGKRVSPGQKGFAAEEAFRDMCGAVGLSYDDMAIVYMGHKEAGAVLIAGKIDVYCATGSPPHPTFAEVDLMHPITLVTLTEEEGAAITKKYPRFVLKTLPPIFYHMEEPTMLLTEPGGELVTTRLSEDIVYGLVKNYIEHPEFVGYYHVSLKDLLEEGTIKKWNEALVTVPYHVGAYRYFKEIGWDIPAEMIPPEAK